MKIYSFTLDEWQNRRLHTAAIRHKGDIIKLLMQSVKLMLSSTPLERPYGQMSLIVSKMSRLFFFKQDQHFSITFPFGVATSDEGLIFTSKDIGVVDEKVTSDVLQILTEWEDSNHNSQKLLDSLIDQSALRPSFLPFYLGLMHSEDGYIRYDHDSANANGRLHPLNHLDLFYSPGNTFKLGLYDRQISQPFVNMLDILTNCDFLEIAERPSQGGRANSC